MCEWYVSGQKGAKIKTNCEEGKGPKSYSALCSGMSYINMESTWKPSIQPS